jgi:hypothetical protein
MTGEKSLHDLLVLIRQHRACGVDKPPVRRKLRGAMLEQAPLETREVLDIFRPS